MAQPPRGRAQRSHNEEDCQDKVCQDTKDKYNTWLKQKMLNKEKPPDCPLDRMALGRNTWSLLHTMAAFYPKKPTVEDKNNMQEFIRLMSVLYPCKHCAHDFREDLKESPPKLDSMESLSLWFCEMHNKVNNKLNKPIFDCSKVDERWRTGPKNGSCDW